MNPPSISIVVPLRGHLISSDDRHREYASSGPLPGSRLRDLTVQLHASPARSRRCSAAPTKSRNSGWALVGFDLNSGWNCTARNHGWSGSSTISTSVPSGLHAGGDQAVLLERLAVVVVELVAVAVPLADLIHAVGLAGQAGRAPARRARPPAASCRPAGSTGRCSSISAITGWSVVLSNSVLLASSSPSTLRANSIDRALHAQADAEERDLRSSGRSGSPRSCPRSRACRTRRARGCRRRRPAAPRRPRVLDLLGLDPHDQHPRPVGDAGVVERLVDRLVGVAVLHVLADDRDRHLVLGVHDPVDHLAPVADVQRGGLAGRAA